MAWGMTIAAAVSPAARSRRIQLAWYFDNQAKLGANLTIPVGTVAVVN